MHSVTCIKQASVAQIRARFLSNTIVHRGVPINHREAVAAEVTPTSVTSRAERSPCTLWDRIHSSPDCGRCAPWVPKLRCCLPNAPLSMTRRYPRRTHARPRSRRSRSYLVGPLSSSSASWPSMGTWPRSAPGSLAAQPVRRNRWPRSRLPQPLAPSAKGPVLREKSPGCEPRATG